MRESGRRVVLLARPGAARERLRAALTEVGADLALEADPTQVEVGELAASKPEVVIVALDSVSEAAIDRLDAVLQDPAIDVMFEEADVAANRGGWDAARWVRHLAAKLQRHGNVLPPGGAADVPASAVGAQPAMPVVDVPVELPITTATDAASWNEDPMPPAEPVPAHPLSDEFTPGVEFGGYGSFDPVAAEMVDLEQNADQVIVFDSQLRDDFAFDVSPTSGASVLPSLDLVFESEIALPVDDAPAMPGATFQFDELSLDDLRGDSAQASPLAEPGLDFDIAEPAPAVPPAAVPTFAGVSGGHVLELVADDAPLKPATAPGSAHAQSNLAEIERRIASLALVDDRPAATVAGAVLLVAGIGGPDGVRQLLGALPEGFPRPVVVRQRLDGGRYDRLVSQMQRATPLPVDLAEPGSALRPGVVYVLPSGVGIAFAADSLCFDESANTIEALPPGDSAVVLLSGSDATFADALSSPAWADAFVAGQAPEGCYDPAASNALAASGRPTAQPAELAQRLAERWSAA